VKPLCPKLLVILWTWTNQNRGPETNL
jgi:hypothetical protein